MGGSQAVWDFWRVAIPLLLFVLGWFLAAQVFAESMNGDTRICGVPEMLGERKIYSIFVYVAACLKYIFNEDFQPYIFASMIPMIVCTVAGLLFVFVWGIVRTMNARARTLHGTARWARKKDLKLNGLFAKEPGVVLAQLNKAKVVANKKNNTALQMKLKKEAAFVTHSGKANTLLLASTGSGKGVGVIIPTLLSYKGSMIIFDPKGENFNITAGWRGTFSRIIRFAPTSRVTARFNPVMAIRDGDEFAFRDANLISDIIFAPPKAGSNGTEEYFNNSAKDLLTGLLLHLRFCEDVPESEKSLSGALRALSKKDESSWSESQGEDSSTQGDELFLSMLEKEHYYQYTNPDGSIRRVKADNLHKLIVGSASRAKDTNAKEKASVFKTVFSKLQLFDDPMLDHATSGNDFEIEDFIHSEEPITLYLTVPYSDVQRISPVFKLLISFMLKKFSEGETQHGSVKLKNHLIFLLDEFPVLGYFPDIAQVMGVLRGYGINFLIVCQALSQLVDVYGKNHPFLDHCVVQVVYAPGSNEDAEEFSKAIGNRTFHEMKVSSSGKRFGGSSSFNFNENSAGQRLLDAADIKRIPGDRCLILAHGMQPYMATKCVYYEDSRFEKKLELKPPLTMKELKSELAGLPSNKLRKKQLQLEKSRPVVEVRGNAEQIDKDLGICESDDFDKLAMNLSQAEREAYEKAPVLAGAFFEVAEDQQDMVETHIVVADSESNQDDEDASYFL